MLVEADMRRVNQLIVARLDSPIRLIPELAGHLVAAGGKRVRPMLTLIAAQLCGYRGERHIRLAAAVEFIHTATLLHDDVVDQSELRRGLATANAIWGNKPSVLVGDFLFARAFQLMVEDGSLEVLGILANASAVIAEGEVAQLMTANDAETTEATYLRVVERQDRDAVRGGGADRRPGRRAPGAPRPTALRDYGENLGIAFQLIDDVLDYSAREVVLGKSLGDDFRDGKITLPVVLAFARGSAEERRFWRRTLEQVEQRDGDFAHAIELLAPPRRAGRQPRARRRLRRRRAPRARGVPAVRSPSRRCSIWSTSASSAPTERGAAVRRRRAAVHCRAGRNPLYTGPNFGSECSSAW